MAETKQEGQQARKTRKSDDITVSDSQGATDAQVAAVDGVVEHPAGELDSVGSVKANAALEHSQGGNTTRQDTLDAGVPMEQGSPAERVGPEDALGPGPKRGHYEERIARGPHLESVPVPGGSKPIRDEDGNVVDFTPNAVLSDQEARARDVGDEPGVKGGVET